MVNSNHAMMGSQQRAARILLIDDDDQIRTALREMLEREGYEVAEAPDGKAGCSYFRNEGADLVITDILMPEKDGIETIIEIRRDFPEAKIIAISGGGDIDPNFYLHLSSQFGVSRTLTKPFEREDLLASVRELMDQQE